ncbi:competence protein CoiA family protein [Deinococcus aquaticus]
MPRAVPYAADAQGALVDPALVMGRGAFFCLECHEPVSHRREHLRQGRTVVAHFSHQSGSSCVGESVLHIAAKMRLLEALTLRERPFMIRRVCQRLACEVTQDEPWELPPFEIAEAERVLGTYRLDVAALNEGVVSVGFEVYVSHRVDTVKAANLTVPWLELQADATARDPYVLQPVVDSLLTGDEEADIRESLRVTRMQLAQRLKERIALACTLDVRVNGYAVPGRLINKLFRSRQEGISFLSPWWCPECAAKREQQAQAALLAEQNRIIAVREQAERAAREEEERLRQREVHLAEQRSVFGPWLSEPFPTWYAADLEQHAPVLRAVCQYLHQYWPGAGQRISEWAGETLIARRCWKCQQPIICLDSRGYIENFRVFYPMVEYFKPQDARRGYFISKCLACRQRQRLQDIREGKHVVLRDDMLPRWVAAFGGLARAAVRPDRQTTSGGSPKGIEVGHLN